MYQERRYQMSAQFKNPDLRDDVYGRMAGHYRAIGIPPVEHVKKENGGALHLSAEAVDLLTRAIEAAQHKHSNTRVRLSKINGK